MKSIVWDFFSLKSRKPLSFKLTWFTFHKIFSTFLLVCSVILFFYHKVLNKQSKKGDGDKFDDSSSRKVGFTNIWQLVKSQCFALFQLKEFELSIDVDATKMFIFMNTIFMSNISISKKLSHND